MKSYIYFQSQEDESSFKKLSDLLACKFIDPASIIHKGRNTIWTANINYINLAIKEFSHGLKSNLLYTLRSSKAKRSMQNAIELKRRGISTPQPIAFAENRNSLGILQRCWYVSKYEKSLSYAEAFPLYRVTITYAFAEFVAKLHNNGILHNDLNNTNVRVNVSPQGIFHFSLIDLNRMHIYPKGQTIPNNKWMKDVCRFCSIDNGFTQFASLYLMKRGLPESLITEMLKSKRKHDRKNIFLHRIKKHIGL